MARIRTIKPEFPQSETVGRMSREARLLFILLWTVADDSGRARGHSRMLASLLYPYDRDAQDLIESWFTELEEGGAVRRYSVGDTQYFDIPNWLKHQKIDKPSASKFPPFDEGSPKPREPSRAPIEGSCGDQGSRIKDQGRDLKSPVDNGDNGDSAKARAPLPLNGGGTPKTEKGGPLRRRVAELPERKVASA